MSTKFQNEPNFTRRACVELRHPVHSRGIEPDRVRQNKAKSAFLYPCIPASLYSCFSPNKPNFTIFHVLLPFALYLFPFLRNEPNFKTPHLCNLRNLWFRFLQNKPNFPNFDLKMRVSAKNKPNSISQFSTLNSQFRSPRLRNEPNSLKTEGWIRLSSRG